MVFLLDPEDESLPYTLRHFPKCKHFTQIDPDPRKNPPEGLDDLLARINHCKPSTDAIIIAGTQNVNAQNLLDCTNAALRTELAVYVAPSSPKQISEPLFNLISAESVGLLLYHAENAQNPKYMNKPHAEFEAFLCKTGINLDKHRIDLGYIVLNRECAVGKLTKPDLKKKRMVGYALSAARKYPVVYLEGSGEFVGEEILRKVSNAFTEQNKDAYLLVGGGICCGKSAESALKYADGIVVGNVLEQGNWKGYEGTIKSAKRVK